MVALRSRILNVQNCRVLAGKNQNANFVPLWPTSLVAIDWDGDEDDDDNEDEDYYNEDGNDDEDEGEMGEVVVSGV